jgi:glycosyltransferase involved in cell wall biosynthesis
MTRYIIDVTQLVHWSGNLSGIPRVMHELTIRFGASSHNTVFISWVKEVGQMCVVDIKESLIDGNRHPAYLTQEGLSPTVALTPKISPKMIVKKLAAKSRLDHTKLYKKIRKSTATHATEHYQRYTPQHDDKMLIVYGEWWDQDYINLLVSYANNDVELFPVCHDIVPMVVPQFSGNSASLADFITKIYPLSKCVISISKSTKNDLTKWMRFHGLPIPPIKLFREGEFFATIQAPRYDMEQKYNIKSGAFIIFVGTIEPRKNHTLLYYVYKLAETRGINLPQLLIIGRIGHHSDEIIDYIKNDPEVKGKISIMNDVDDAELEWFYRNSLCMISPSWYEGWGIPIVESIVKGNPTVCSNTSSMTEIAEDCVLHFNPASTDECLDAIIKMLEPDVLAEYRKRCAAYRPHSWDDAFRQVVKIMEK